MMYVVILAIILVALYYLYWLIHDIFLYSSSQIAMFYLRYLFQVSSCVIDKDSKLYTLHFAKDADISKKQLQTVIAVFQFFFEDGTIVSLEEKGCEFVPCFNREKLNEVMERTMKISAGLICGYWEWDFFTKFLLEKKYDALYKEHEKFAEELQKISAAPSCKYIYISPESEVLPVEDN